METNNFEAAIAANEAAQAHALEIRQTRVGGLGGSDAAIIHKIGEQGMAALTATDMKRLAIMTGKQEPDNWGGNAYTNAGHAFEDYAEKALPLNANYKREEYLERKLSRSFKVFAHADFTERNMEGELERLTVCECKFVQSTTASVIAKYYAQLQWYYMLGADAVVLYHGTGTVEPFKVETGELVQIQRDETEIAILLNGIKILDDALAKGWQPTAQDKIAYEDTPEMVQRAFDKLQEIKSKKAELDAIEAEAKSVVKIYLEDWALAGIVAAGEIRHTAVYNKPQTKMVFNAEKFLQEHPEFDCPEYYKKQTTKSSVTFK